MFMIFSSTESVQLVMRDLNNLESVGAIKSVKIVQGCYAGVEETAYIVYAGYDVLPAVHDLVLNDYKQQALLVVDFNNSCTMYTSGRGVCGVNVGRWRKVSQAYAREQDAYTRIANDYFVVE